MLKLRDESDLDAYDDATEAFRRGGSREHLIADLAALDLSAEEILWHVEERGRRRVTYAVADD